MQNKLEHIHSIQLHNQDNFRTSTQYTMPFKLNFVTHKWEFVRRSEPAALITEASASTLAPDSSITHILPGTEGMAYYTCRWCRCEVKNSYFKYLKHHGACPRLRRNWCVFNYKTPQKARRGLKTKQKAFLKANHILQKEFILETYLSNSLTHIACCRNRDRDRPLYGFVPSMKCVYKNETYSFQ